MDVVRANIDAIGGTVDVKSVLGQGTRFGIKIPLTLAIVSALIVELAGDRFAIPQLAVVELVRVRNNSEHRIEHIKDAAVLRLRNKLLPLVHLKVLLKIDEGADCLAENGFIVVTQVGSQTFGIVVDAVFHTEEIVVKPMSSKLRHIPMFAGNTILGDGSVIMIIEPNGIAQSIGNVAIDRDGAAAEQEADRQDTDSGIELMLVFRAGSPQPRAVLLSLVTRLEEVDVRKIESANGRSLVQYRGQLMPLIPVNDDVRIKSRASSLCWCSPTRGAPWPWWSTRSSISSSRDWTSSCSASGPASLARRSSEARPPKSSTSAITCRWHSTIGRIGGNGGPPRLGTACS